MLCCGIFIFSTTHRPSAKHELSQGDELPNVGLSLKGKENTQLEEHRIPREQASCEQ